GHRVIRSGDIAQVRQFLYVARSHGELHVTVAAGNQEHVAGQRCSRSHAGRNVDRSIAGGRSGQDLLAGGERVAARQVRLRGGQDVLGGGGSVGLGRDGGGQFCFCARRACLFCCDGTCQG